MGLMIVVPFKKNAGITLMVRQDSTPSTPVYAFAGTMPYLITAGDNTNSGERK